MTGRSFFEIGGKIIELENDVAFGMGKRSAKSHKDRKSVIKPVVSTLDKTVGVLAGGIEAAEENKFGFEEAGKIVGLWFGLVVAAATLPVTVVDGPLPFMDAAWLIASARITKSAIDVGGMIGEVIDDVIS
jgi:hypothetical protein